MKDTKKNIIAFWFPARFILILTFSLWAVRCQDDIKEWEPDSNDMVITDYVYSQPELFSEFGAVLKATGIENILRVRGPFTLLLPTDEAMKEYYARLGVSSWEELDTLLLADMVYNHIFAGQMSAGSMPLGALLYENGLGDKVACDLPGIDILINKKAVIIKRDIYTSNGIVQHIDYVLDPIVQSIYDVLASDPGYSIFLQGLERTGLADTLKMFDFPYGNSTARTQYTILAVPDTLYNREGIYSVDDLIETYNDGPGDLTNSENGVFRYMEYHCLSGTHYFSDFAPGSGGAPYYLVTNNNYLNIRVELDYKINKVNDSVFTGFYYDNSNIPAKNGTIHTVNTLLPYMEADPAEIIFEVTHFFDMQQGSYYLNHYQRFYDGLNTFEGLKWQGDYLLYYLKPGHNLVDDDGLNMNGHFWVEVTTPKIRKGKYMLGSYGFLGGADNASCATSVDGKYLGICNFQEGAWGGDPLEIGIVDFTETASHKIRLKTVVPGQMFWDYLSFTPVD